MNHTIANQFKKLFESQKNEILFASKIPAQGFGLSTDDLSDEADLASAVLEQSIKLQLKGREMMFLKKINEALTKINDGTFGVCESCEEDIELSRLEVRPTASLCIHCKEMEEITESRSADTMNGSARLLRMA